MSYLHLQNSILLRLEFLCFFLSLCFLLLYILTYFSAVTQFLEILLSYLYLLKWSHPTVKRMHILIRNWRKSKIRRPIIKPFQQFFVSTYKPSETLRKEDNTRDMKESFLSIASLPEIILFFTRRFLRLRSVMLIIVTCSEPCSKNGSRFVPLDIFVFR